MGYFLQQGNHYCLNCPENVVLLMKRSTVSDQWCVGVRVRTLDTVDTKDSAGLVRPYGVVTVGVIVIMVGIIFLFLRACVCL